MTRTICVLVLLLALVGIAITEQICVNKVYTHMGTETMAIITMVKSTPYDEDKKAEFDETTIARIDSLHDYWRKRERTLGIAIRHIDLSYISDAIIYARNFVHSGNWEESVGGLARLEYFVKSYHEIYKLNGVNIL